MTKPDLIVHAGNDRYGLEWASGAVHVFRKIEHHITNGTDGAVYCEWTPLVSGRLPPEVASVISGYCAQKMAKDALLSGADGWEIRPDNVMVKHYGKVS